MKNRSLEAEFFHVDERTDRQVDRERERERERERQTDMTKLIAAFCNFANVPNIFLISNFRRVLNLLCVLLGVSPASDCCMPTFRNPLSGPSSRAGCRV
jgi:hypothetical protein